MTASIAVAAFLAGAVVSLATGWLLVSRLERVGERLGLSEALLGIVAALAADAPEVTAAVSAMASGEQRLGAGVVIGSNVFNLAALLGLGAVVAGRIGLHRKVVLLAGTVAVAVAAVCLAVVLGVVPPAAGCLLGFVVVALYIVALGVPGRSLARLRLPRPWISWLRSAVAEEEAELEPALRPAPARWPDVLVAAGSLVVVVAASITMERAAAALGNRFAIPEIVVGGLVLAAVTSLPNAVAAVYLASRGRGAATLSTALNSNTINVAIGLLVPAALIGLGRPVIPDGPGRGVVHRLDRGGARPSLPGPRHLAAARHLDHRRLPGVRRLASDPRLRRTAGDSDRDHGWPGRCRSAHGAAGPGPPPRCQQRSATPELPPACQARPR